GCGLLGDVSFVGERHARQDMPPEGRTPHVVAVVGIRPILVPSALGMPCDHGGFVNQVYAGRHWQCFRLRGRGLLGRQGRDGGGHKVRRNQALVPHLPVLQHATQALHHLPAAMCLLLRGGGRRFVGQQALLIDAHFDRPARGVHHRVVSGFGLGGGIVGRAAASLQIVTLPHLVLVLGLPPRVARLCGHAACSWSGQSGVLCLCHSA